MITRDVRATVMNLHSRLANNAEKIASLSAELAIAERKAKAAGREKDAVILELENAIHATSREREATCEAKSVSESLKLRLEASDVRAGKAEMRRTELELQVSSFASSMKELRHRVVELESELDAARLDASSARDMQSAVIAEHDSKAAESLRSALLQMQEARVCESVANEASETARKRIESLCVEIDGLRRERDTAEESSRNSLAAMKAMEVAIEEMRGEIDASRSLRSSASRAEVKCEAMERSLIAAEHSKELLERRVASLERDLVSVMRERDEVSGAWIFTVVLGIGTCARAILQRDTPSRSDSDDAIVFHFGAGTPYASRSGVGYVV